MTVGASLSASVYVTVKVKFVVTTPEVGFTLPAVSVGTFPLPTVGFIVLPAAGWRTAPLAQPSEALM